MRKINILGMMLMYDIIHSLILLSLSFSFTTFAMDHCASAAAGAAFRDIYSEFPSFVPADNPLLPLAPRADDQKFIPLNPYQNLFMDDALCIPANEELALSAAVASEISYLSENEDQTVTESPVSVTGDIEHKKLSQEFPKEMSCTKCKRIFSRLSNAIHHVFTHFRKKEIVDTCISPDDRILHLELPYLCNGCNIFIGNRQKAGGHCHGAPVSQRTEINAFARTFLKEVPQEISKKRKLEQSHNEMQKKKNKVEYKVAYPVDTLDAPIPLILSQEPLNPSYPQLPYYPVPVPAQLTCSPYEVSMENRKDPENRLHILQQQAACFQALQQVPTSIHQPFSQPAQQVASSISKEWACTICKKVTSGKDATIKHVFSHFKKAQIVNTNYNRLDLPYYCTKCSLLIDSRERFKKTKHRHCDDGSISRRKDISEFAQTFIKGPECEPLQTPNKPSMLNREDLEKELHDLQKKVVCLSNIATANSVTGSLARDG
jgi:hypothetical protein